MKTKSSSFFSLPYRPRLEKQMRIFLILFTFGFFSAQGQSVTFCDLEFRDSIYYLNNVPYSGKIEYKNSSGRIVYTGQLKDGLHDSIFFNFKKNGKLSSVEGYCGGKRAYYYRYSNLWNNVPSIEIMTFPYYEFYSWKSFKKQGYYRDGEQQGLWKEYFENGDIKSEIVYSKGEIVNPYFKWDKKGRKTQIYHGFISRKIGKLRYTKYGYIRTRID